MDQVEKENVKKANRRNKTEKTKKKSKPQKFKSIKRTFVWYLPFCVLTAYLGAYGIGWVANELQYWMEIKYSDVDYQTLVEEAYKELDEVHGGESWDKLSKMPVGTQIEDDGIITEEPLSQETEKYLRIQYVVTKNGMTYYDVQTLGKFFSDNPWHQFIYGVISYGQGPLMIGWVLLCVFVTAILFYKRELEKPIGVLMDASDKISENCLDFTMPPVKHNELGKLCRSFEDMRQALYENNRELWHTLEERKRLNAAFSQDIRTPLAVVKGYQEMLANYVPAGKISEEQLLDMIQTMGGQIERLENYTQKMSAVQKLEDIVPERLQVSLTELAEQCKESGKLLAGELEYTFRAEFTVAGKDVAQKAEEVVTKQLFLDKELFLEVFENLISNGARFAKSRLLVTLKHEKSENTERLFLIVEDDGAGFSEEALQKAAEPFYGSEKDGKVHFGLGLYICKSICEKHGGALVLENKMEEEKVFGGRVLAGFDVEDATVTV